MMEDDDDVDWMRLDSASPANVRPAPADKKRGKVIMLDDLLRDREKKKKQRLKRESHREDGCSSTDEDEDGESDKNVEIVKKMLKDLESEATTVDEKGSLLKWGEQVFHRQEHSVTPECCNASPSFAFEDQGTEGNSKAEGLLSTGLLRSWVISEGRCDEKISRWTFFQLVQSASESLEKAACKLLCDLLLHEGADGKPVCELEWLPNFTEIMDVFRSYGYREASVMTGGEVVNKTDVPYLGTITERTPGSDRSDGPPANIRSFVEFLLALFKTRNRRQALSASEAEELVVTLAHCQMDHRVENISPIFRSCLQTIVHYFTDEEWVESCSRIATSLSRISTSYVNQLRAAKSLHAGDNRLCSLQRAVAIKLLGRSAKRDLECSEEVVSIFKPIKMKKSDFDFLNLCHQLTAADIYLWSEPDFEENQSVRTNWLDFLKRCTAEVSSSDERPHATQARNWASFLWQKFQFEKNESFLSRDSKAEDCSQTSS